MRWTEQEIELLKEKLEEGLTHKEIGTILDRTEKALRVKASRLGIKSLNNKRKTIKEFNFLIKNKPFKCLSTKYINNRSNLKFKCNTCSHIWKASADSILNSSSGCPKCCGNIKKTHSEFLNEIKDKSIICLSAYTSALTKIEVKCTICNHVWNVRPNDILNNHGCPKCAMEKRKGHYSALNKQTADLLTYNIYLYIIKLVYKNEAFYKIGLTKNKDRSRYRYYGEYSVVKEVEFMEFKAYNAVLAEKHLHHFYSKYKYQPKYKFGGHTECFNLSIGEN